MAFRFHKDGFFSPVGQVAPITTTFDLLRALGYEPPDSNSNRGGGGGKGKGGKGGKKTSVKRRKGGAHPATRAFQALRIEVTHPRRNLPIKLSTEPIKLSTEPIKLSTELCATSLFSFSPGKKEKGCRYLCPDRLRTKTTKQRQSC
jgi:hypothetical protein